MEYKSSQTCVVMTARRIDSISHSPKQRAFFPTMQIYFSSFSTHTATPDVLGDISRNLEYLFTYLACAPAVINAQTQAGISSTRTCYC
jgi:hypothetical protein